MENASWAFLSCLAHWDLELWSRDVRLCSGSVENVQRSWTCGSILAKTQDENQCISRVSESIHPDSFIRKVSVRGPLSDGGAKQDARTAYFSIPSLSRRGCRVCSERHFKARQCLLILHPFYIFYFSCVALFSILSYRNFIGETRAYVAWQRWFDLLFQVVVCCSRMFWYLRSGSLPSLPKPLERPF